MNINLSLSPAAIPVNWLVVAVYKSTSPNVVADFQAFPAPHLAPQNVTFTGLDPQTYIVITYESVDGTPTGTVRHKFFYDPSFQVAEIRLDLFLEVNITPGMVEGETTYEDATLEGWEYAIELRQSYGTLKPEVDWQYLPNPQIGWELLLPDYTFQPEEVYILHFYPKISVFTPVENTANLFSSLLTLTANATLVPTDTGKAVLIQSATPTIKVTLPLVDDIEELKPICFMSNGGSHINAELATQGGNVIQFLNNTPTSIFLGQGESVWLMRGGDKYLIINKDGHFSTVGQIMHDYLNNRINTIFAAGQLLLRANYPRLWQFVQSLDASMLVSDVAWNIAMLNNKSKYSTGDGATTFRVPLLYEQGFLRGVDGVVRKAATKEIDSVIEHDHFLVALDTDTELDTYLSKVHSTGGNFGYTLWGANTPPTAYKSSKFGSTETKPKNTAVYFLINI